MSRTATRSLAVGQVVTAVLLLLVAAVFGAGLTDARSEVADLRAELADTRTRLAAAEADRDRLQTRVDALTVALLAAGVDPAMVPDDPPAAETPRTGPQTAGPAAPSPAAGPAQAPAGDVPTTAPSPAATDPPEPTPAPPPSPQPGPLCSLLTLCG